MKKHVFLLTAVVPFMAMALPVDRTATGFKTEANGTEIEVQWFGPQTVRVFKTPAGEPCQKNSLSVVATSAAPSFSVADKSGTIVMKGPKLHVSVASDGTVSFALPDGTNLLSETPGSATFTRFNDAGRDTYTVSQGFAVAADEGLYGLGQIQNLQMSQRNMSRYLVQGNIEDVSPIFQSSKGYGVFWDNYSGTEYTDGNGTTSFRSDVGDCIDYYFMYGGNADGVVAQIRDLTGSVPMMPLWSYGFMQSRERYTSQEETMAVVRKYRELGIPIDVIIQDWQYWDHNYLWNAMEFLNPQFNKPQEMIDSIHSMNAKIMISIWQSFGPVTRQYRELDARNLLFDFKTWPLAGVNAWPPRDEYPSGVRVYDAYSSEARDIYWKYLKPGLYDLGIDGWWMDSTEPDHYDESPKDFDHQTALGSYRSVRNAYPLMTVGGVYDHQRADSTDRRVVILTRSGFVGQQRYASNVWSGDVVSTWDMLRRQVPAGLNFSATGMPHWNSDLGGFFASLHNGRQPYGAGTRNPQYQELYVRWLQFGVFTPMMRSHGTEIPREIYYYGQAGEPVYDALVDAIKLRYRILPYTYSTAWDVTHNNSTFMRALFMDFADDAKALDNTREYMYGDAFLVCPVVDPQYTPEEVPDYENGAEYVKNIDFTKSSTMEVYLPAGAKWYDFYSNELYDGGQNKQITTSFNRIPLFVRAGSIVPFGPDVQYSTEKAWDNLTIAVYPGADASFTLYEDEGDNYNYENGAYTEIPMTWNDRSRTLTIGARAGSYPGMLSNRSFTITLPDGTTKTVKYNGRRVRVRM